MRDNTECHFPVDEGDLILQFLRSRIAAVTELFVTGMEAPSVLHYTPGQRFLPHYDFLDEVHPGHEAEIAEGGQRVLTFLLSLNDDYEGGETQFPILGKRYRGRKGNALFFWNVEPDGTPDKRVLHAGLPPTLGEKWMLSQWIRGPLLSAHAFRNPASRRSACRSPAGCRARRCFPRRRSLRRTPCRAHSPHAPPIRS